MPPSTRAGSAHIVVERLSYAPADGRPLFQDLTLSFGRERTGLVGANGTGKTTLVRLLAGELEPVSGSVHRDGVVGVLPQEVRLDPAVPLTAILGIDRRIAALQRLEAGAATVSDLEVAEGAWDLPDRTAALLGRLNLGHLALDRPVGAVSGGEATRVALAGLVLRDADFLLLDEPTNHLDSASRGGLYDFMDEWSGGVVCVSHDRALLRRMDRIVELSSSGVRVYGGNYDEYRHQRDEEDEAAGRELDSARAALRVARRKAVEVRERQARREAQGRRSRAAGGMPKILLNARKARAQGTGARIQVVTAREVEEQRVRVDVARRRVEDRERPRFGIPPTDLAAGRTVLELTDVTVHFAGAPWPVFDRVSLRMTGPERVALVGPNGSGKSTLLRVALGELMPDSGAVRRLGDSETAFLDQHGAALDPSRSLLENLRSFHPAMEESRARHTLARFLFPEPAAVRPVTTLSGGERLRGSLACVLGGERPPSLLVLDEPTNHLDLDALDALEGALREYDGALLVASHDRDFLEAIGVERRVELA